MNVARRKRFCSEEANHGSNSEEEATSGSNFADFDSTDSHITACSGIFATELSDMRGARDREEHEMNGGSRKCFRTTQWGRDGGVSGSDSDI